jgi:thiamine biosynthesis lipoprotein
LPPWCIREPDNVRTVSGTARPRRSWVEQIMGMPVSVLARGGDARSAQADDAVRSVFAELRQVDAVFSPYRPDSDVSRINRGDLAISGAGAELREVADRCIAARTRTAGLFDARRPDGAWDPSGLVKGWATERAVRWLAGVEVDWCLNVGGDVALRCPSGEPFGIGVQDPRDPSRVAAVLRRSAGGVATSGAAARGAHIYDPRSGVAVRGGPASVTVAGPSLETADVLATAAFVAGDGWADLLAGEPGYAGLAVLADGQLVRTPD